MYSTLFDLTSQKKTCPLLTSNIHLHSSCCKIWFIGLHCYVTTPCDSLFLENSAKQSFIRPDSHSLWERHPVLKMMDDCSFSSVLCEFCRFESIDFQYVILKVYKDQTFRRILLSSFPFHLSPEKNDAEDV